MGYFSKALGFLKSPSAAFEKEKNTHWQDAFVYLAVLAIVPTVLNVAALTILGSLFPSIILFRTMSASLPFNLLYYYVIMLISGFIGALWLHLWVYIFGGRRGIRQTLKVMFYSNTPNYFFGWIPILGLFVGIWSLVLEVIGIMKLQNLSRNRAIGAVIVPIIVSIIFVLLFVIFAVLLYIIYSAP